MSATVDYPVALQRLLFQSRVASLGTTDSQEHPWVSLVPFAIDTEQRQLVIHISELAAHTGFIRARPQVSLLIAEPEVAGQPVHDLARVSVQAKAKFLTPNSPVWESARAAYLGRFPDVEFITQLGDFSFVGLSPTDVRYVAGFGAARRIKPQALLLKLNSYTVKQGSWSELQADATVVRTKVFVQEQQVPAELEMDAEDARSLHVVAYRGNTAIGTGRLLTNAHIGRMAVLNEYRKQGVGTLLLQALLDAAQKRGDKVVYLSAQLHALDFYARYGFEPYGEIHQEANIAHRMMRYEF